MPSYSRKALFHIVGGDITVIYMAELSTLKFEKRRRDSDKRANKRGGSKDPSSPVVIDPAAEREIETETKTE